MANPTLLDMPIARDGNKNTIPTTDNGTTGLLSQQYGWQLINAIPPQQGGKAVKREDFNGALYLLSNLLFYLQKGWQFEWDANQNYYAGCIVKDPNNGKMYQRLNDGTSNTAPHSDTTNWKLWDLSMLANYLPSAGGTLGTNATFKTVDGNGHIEIFGGSSVSNGAFLQLMGVRDTGTGVSSWILSAYDTVNSVQNALKSLNGELRWLPDYNGGADYDLGNAAIVAKSFTSNGYIKFASGLIIQWITIAEETGWRDEGGGSYYRSFTLPISFSSKDSCAWGGVVQQVSGYAGHLTMMRLDSGSGGYIYATNKCRVRLIFVGY